MIAWGEQVKVIRPSPDPGDVREITVDVTKMMRDGDLRNNLLLEEGDIVYVPPTPLGWLGLRLQEALFPMTPVLNAYSYPASVNDTLRTYNDYDWSTGQGGTGHGYYGYGYGGNYYGDGSW
jgi:hypothetical protein